MQPYTYIFTFYTTIRTVFFFLVQYAISRKVFKTGWNIIDFDFMISYSLSSPFLLMFTCLFILLFRSIFDICLNDTNTCNAEETKMPRPFSIPSRSDFLVRSAVLGIDSHTQWQAVRIRIWWLLQRSTNLDLHCLQRQGMFGFSRTRVTRYTCWYSVKTLIVVNYDITRKWIL